MSKRGKKKKNRLKGNGPKWGRNLDAANRAEEACYECSIIIANSAQTHIGKTIHVLCSKWEVRQGDFRKTFNEVFQTSPEAYYLQVWNPSGASLPNEAFGPILHAERDEQPRHGKGKKNKNKNEQNHNKSSPQDMAWSILVGMVELAKQNMTAGIRINETTTSA